MSGRGEPSGAEGCLLDNRQSEAGERFAALSELSDPSTFRHFERLGVGPGWRCWEVGAGGTGVTRWLAGRVGARGRVLATDIDVSWAGEASAPPVELRRHASPPTRRPRSASTSCTRVSCWSTSATGRPPCGT